jgi:alpha-glucosidase
VIYQIYPRSFCDSNGDGIGDLEGIISKLDYLKQLGIDAIWLSPFYRSPMADFGYDVADYCDVDPRFGDLETFDRMVKAAHQHGLKVIIDYVPNHTSDQHAWFLESRSSRDNPKRDWYIWRDPKADGSEPNNWGSFFGGPAWTLDPLTGQYYLHQFCKEQPELNWRNPEVVAAMLDVLRFWMRRGVDGFRMDVVGLLMKDKDLRDNPLDPNAPANLLPNDIFGRQFHTYTEDQDEVHDLIKLIRKTLNEFPDRVGIGELWGPMDRWVRYYGQNDDELQLPFNFRLMSVPWDAAAMRRSVDELEAALPPSGWPNYVLGNHDQIRLATRFGGQAQARLAGMMLLTLRGTPTVYYGDELGMENVAIPADKMQDPQGLQLGPARCRDVARTPMQWDASARAGFMPSGSQNEPWLPLSPDYQKRNVASQAADPTSIYNLYRRLYQLRRTSPALHGGAYRPLDAQPDCFVYLRECGADRKLIVLNFSDQPRKVDAGSAQAKEEALILASTLMDRKGMVSLSSIDLRPYEGLIIDLG